MANKPTGRLAEKWFDGDESRKDGKEAKVAKREEDDCGWKTWRWVKESETRDEISSSGIFKVEVECIEEM